MTEPDRGPQFTTRVRQTVGVRLKVHLPTLAALGAVLVVGGCATVVPTASLPSTTHAGPSSAGTPGGHGIDFPTIHLSGHGDGEAAFTSPDATTAIAVVSSAGVGPLSVESLAVDRSVIEVLVSTASPYTGTVLFDWQAGNQAVAFRVTGAGDWTIDVEPVEHAPSWAASSLTGSGDRVLRLAEPISGTLTIHVVHPAAGHLAITGFIGDSDEGPGSFADLARDPLLSVTGPFDGVIKLADGSIVLTITAEGDWTLAPA
jgi:hypothetical protein